ncbi:MAG: hypothetical protein K9G38_06815, partial [Bacteroidales bacterium]|nr:hypothetical protein [Bacteroidales bacterium]
EYSCLSAIVLSSVFRGHKEESFGSACNMGDNRLITKPMELLINITCQEIFSYLGLTLFGTISPFILKKQKI